MPANHKVRKIFEHNITKQQVLCIEQGARTRFNEKNGNEDLVRKHLVA